MHIPPLNLLCLLVHLHSEGGEKKETLPVKTELDGWTLQLWWGTEHAFGMVTIFKSLIGTPKKL